MKIVNVYTILHYTDKDAHIIAPSDALRKNSTIISCVRAVVLYSTNVCNVNKCGWPHQQILMNLLFYFVHTYELYRISNFAAIIILHFVFNWMMWLNNIFLFAFWLHPKSVNRTTLETSPCMLRVCKGWGCVRVCCKLQLKIWT